MSLGGLDMPELRSVPLAHASSADVTGSGWSRRPRPECPQGMSVVVGL